MPVLKNSNNLYVPFEGFPDVLTVEQMQKALGVGRSTAYKLINNNEIGHIRIGTAIKIPKLALINYISKYTRDEKCYNWNCSGQAIQAVREGII